MRYVALSLGVLFALSVLVAPGILLAEDEGSQGGDINNQQPQSSGGQVVLPNPLGEGSDFYDLIDRFIQVMTVFAVPILVALIIIAGFFYLFGGADPSKRTTATNIIKYGIIGFIVIIFARAIVAIVQGVIS